MADLSDTIPAFLEASASSNKISHPSTTSFGTSSTKIIGIPVKDKFAPLPPEAMDKKSNAELAQKRNQKSTQSTQGMLATQNNLEVDDLKSIGEDVLEKSDKIDGFNWSTSKVKDTRNGSPRLINSVFQRKNFEKGKAQIEPDSPLYTSHSAEGIIDTSLSWSVKTAKLANKASKVSFKRESETNGKTSAASNSKIAEISRVPDTRLKELLRSRVKDGASKMVAKENERSRLREKGEFSQSSKSSMGEYSSSTSEESSASGSSHCCDWSPVSKDKRWEAIHSVQNQYGFLSLRHFKLLRRLGFGDIGTVYLAELVGTKCLFALKAMDNEFLARRKNLVRAQTEKEILQMLDHPFLPTLYTHFTTDKLSCLVMDYCPGGDLHVIRQKKISRCFSEQAARFYVAEVLLAMEYLHMLGIVYRDLKPENVLVREDGHIMLTDFDLSLRSVVNPTLLISSSPTIKSTRKILSGICSESSCMDPFCFQPSWQISCFTPRLLTATSKTQANPLPQLVAEPIDARSNSFVGTHEYLAPEIVKGEGHGSSVDWWTCGIFLYELLYGRTPFKGSTNVETLANVVSQPLRLPETPLVSFHAKDLIRGLLMKESQNRLGFLKGAAEVKQHPFFSGLNWALIRCAVPPEQPRFHDEKSMGVDSGQLIEFMYFSLVKKSLCFPL